MVPPNQAWKVKMKKLTKREESIPKNVEMMMMTMKKTLKCIYDPIFVKEKPLDIDAHKKKRFK